MVKLGVMGNRGDLTNEQWERIEPLLPKVKTKRGRPAQDHRKLLNGIVWVLRTGAPWRDMPERYGKWTTICSRCKKSSPEREALGRSRGGFSTKIHIRCEGTGRLITFLLTPGQESDIGQAQELMETGAIRRRSGQVRLRPNRLVADKGYTSSAFRNYLHRYHIRCTI